MIEGLARQVLRHYGVVHQKAKTLEEIGELILSLQKDLISVKK